MRGGGAGPDLAGPAQPVPRVARRRAQLPLVPRTEGRHARAVPDLSHGAGPADRGRQGPARARGVSGRLRALPRRASGPRLRAGLLGQGRPRLVRPRADRLPSDRDATPRSSATRATPRGGSGTARASPGAASTSRGRSSGSSPRARRATRIRTRASSRRGAAPTATTQDRWKPPARFDHDKTAFPLTGAHGPLACASCHPSGAGGVVRFKGTPHQSCASCHRDPHAGRMGATCASCHSTAGWNRIDSGRFDHGKTRFPLTGRHEKVACAGCHARGPGGMKFQGTSFASCASCHKDPHAGRLGAELRRAATRPPASSASSRGSSTTTARASRCAASTWRSSATRATVPAGRRPLKHARCTDCHEDRHAGQLAGRADGGRCESCHDVSGFKPARFSVEDHARTRMPLTGRASGRGLRRVPSRGRSDRLRSIGVRPPPGSPPQTEQFRFASTACSACHADPHGGRTARFGSV